MTRHTFSRLLAFLYLLAMTSWMDAAAATKTIEDDAAKPLRQRQFVRLVSRRFDAIETAFGSLSGALGMRVEVVFKRDEEFPDGETMYAASYESERNLLVFSSRVLYQALPTTGIWLVQYWPFYENELLRNDFPVVELVDTALWEAFLQEAASVSGESWPGKDCSSAEIAKRLPCRMIVRGVMEHIRQVRTPLFNENRIDRILPENYADFCRRGVSATSREYQDVERYGGILLLKPLIVEFGVPRTLAYAARTPFSVQENNMRASVLSYQERARAALAW